MVLAALDETLFGPRQVAAVWVTPLLGLESVRRGAASKPWPALVVAGGADPYHEPEAHEALLRATGAQSLVIAGADHLLEVRGDVLATVNGLSQLARAVLAFARGTSVRGRCSHAIPSLASTPLHPVPPPDDFKSQMQWSPRGVRPRSLIEPEGAEESRCRASADSSMAPCPRIRKRLSAVSELARCPPLPRVQPVGGTARWSRSGTDPRLRRAPGPRRRRCSRAERRCSLLG